MTERRDAIENTLSLHRACPEGVAWARNIATWEEAFRTIEAPDWLLWACDVFGYRNDRKLRTFAVKCASRSQSLWPDPEAARALTLATKAAQGTLSADDLHAELLATRRAAARIVTHPDYSEAMSAAACAVLATMHESALEAAKTAARESARAIAWDPTQPASWKEEAAFQVTELRALIGEESAPQIAKIRASHRGSLHVL